MKYELVYYLMCIRDGDTSENQHTREIKAENDENAVEIASRFLQAEYSGTSVRPWYPMLFQGNERLVAVSDPAYPPEAHELALNYCATLATCQLKLTF